MFSRTITMVLTTLVLTGIFMPNAALADPVYLSCYAVNLSGNHSRQTFTVTWESHLGQVSHMFDSGQGFRAAAVLSPYTLSYQNVKVLETLTLTLHYELRRETLDILVTTTIASRVYPHRIAPETIKAEGLCTRLPEPKSQF